MAKPVPGHSLSSGQSATWLQLLLIDPQGSESSAQLELVQCLVGTRIAVMHVGGCAEWQMQRTPTSARLQCSAPSLGDPPAEAAAEIGKRA